jgi:ArsR family transcriptional regulator, arsenate/arsenite/antimonite-responsive transcriptional repressor
MATIKNVPSLDSREARLVSTLQSLGDPTRFRMFKLLQGNTQMCVSEIAESLGISVPAVSQHFRIFELVGIVGKQRNGQKICYQLKYSDPLVKNLIKLS